MKILRAYGIPERIVQAISNIYSSTRAKVISPDWETPTFDIVAGVLQGDTLTPYLFIITLNYALRQAINGREEDLGFIIIPSKEQKGSGSGGYRPGFCGRHFATLGFYRESPGVITLDQ